MMTASDVYAHDNVTKQNFSTPKEFYLPPFSSFSLTSSDELERMEEKIVLCINCLVEVLELFMMMMMNSQ
jgi:hypothetical protein